MSPSIKYICAPILTLLLTVTYGFAQQTSLYLDNDIYVKFVDSYTPTWDNDRFLEIELFVPLTDVNDDSYFKQVENSFFFIEGDEKLKRTIRVKLNSQVKVTDFIATLEQNPIVEYAERIPRNFRQDEPNDVDLAEQWSLENINAEEAWNIAVGSKSIDIGVVDDAFDVSHEDLIDNIQGGWDVANDDPFVKADVASDTHGTRVAGVAAATTNNSFGMASIGWNVDFIPIKSTAEGAITHGYEGILKAAQEGAEIINCSWGGGGYSTTNQNIINHVYNNYNSIVVAAAGNDNTAVEHYPAAYDNVIAVAGTNANDDRRPSSNYGSWVDVAAPGTSIFTTLPQNVYGRSSGTSFSSPLVSGLLALIWSVDTTRSKEDVIGCLLNSAEPLSWSGSGHGRIDAFAAVQCAIENKTNEDVFLAKPMATPVVVPAGGELNLEIEQHYAGPESTVPTVTLNYYLSEDCVWDELDILLSSQTAGPINSAIAFSEEVASVIIPEDTPAGITHILIVADALNVVDESNEENNQSCVEIEVDRTLAVSGDVLLSRLSVYPNPTNNLLNVSSTKGIKSIRVLDPLGRLVKIMTGTHQITLEGLPSGPYYLEATNEQNFSTMVRVIKM